MNDPRENPDEREPNTRAIANSDSMADREPNTLDLADPMADEREPNTLREPNTEAS